MFSRLFQLIKASSLLILPQQIEQVSCPLQLTEQEGSEQNSNSESIPVQSEKREGETDAMQRTNVKNQDQSTNYLKDDLRCSCYSCANMSNIIREKFGQPKISYFGAKILVKKYITSFDVSMYNMWCNFFMKECKTPGNAQANIRSLTPVQFDISTSTCKYMGNR